MPLIADRQINKSNVRPPRSELKRKRDIAQVASVLLHLRDEHGDSALEEALKKVSRQELRDCPECAGRTAHRDALYLACGGWN